MNDINDTIEQRAVTVAAMLRALAEECVDVYCDPDAVRDVRAAALEFLRATGGSDALRLGATIEWHTGCHCHGDDNSETVHADTIAEMGATLAAHKHAERMDTDDVVWVLALDATEADELKAAYDRTSDRTLRRVALTEAVAKARGVLDARRAEVARAQVSLNAICADLNEVGLAKRESELARLSALRDEQAAVVEAAMADLAAHDAEAQ